MDERMEQDGGGGARVGRIRLAGFAAGDLAFNLYWQSAILYLLFYYTDALGLRVETAATIYLVASVWDGLVSFAVGVLVDRRGAAADHRRVLIVGAMPLGLAFCAAYAPPPLTGRGAEIAVLAGHLVFRTAYALVNIPYLAMSARVSANSRDRAFVAGLRMLAGTAAAVLVALGTVPLGGAVMGVAGGPRAFLGAALLFAGIASVVLILVGWTFRDALVCADAPPAPRPRLSVALAGVARNRAFTTLAAAMMAMVVATSVLNKSVLYYFKYVFGDQAAGQLALGAMMAVSAAAVPAWMIVARGIGVRRLWFAAIALCSVGLAVFALADLPRAGAMQLFLVGMQAATVGLHFAFWAMLPDVIDHGERTGGVRAEGIVFGIVALLQRVAIGIATLLIGVSFGEAGYVANVAQTPATLAAMRMTIALVPLAGFVLSGLLMMLSPMRAERRAAPRPPREADGT
ncbi:MULTISPECIES: MFS transporter [unclassified Sphingomonas]|uniref:MFS transporter n=1 Tax=unclassified Sphingomonas TaxID=196159 RepID=UPI001E4E3057|nr:MULTISPECIES: MFS transporter [unclassified Sphingomonas]